MASCLKNLPTVFKLIPSLAGINIGTSRLPFFEELRKEYTILRDTHKTVAAFEASLDKAVYFDFDGKCHTKFHPKGLVPAKRLPADISTFMTPSSDATPPAQRSFCSIVHHDGWRRLLIDLQCVDLHDAVGNTTPTFIDVECSRLISMSLQHSGDWLSVMPSTYKQRSDKVTIGLQQRLGLFVSAATAELDAVEADGYTVTTSHRLGIHLAHGANHQTPHKWLCVAWRDAEAAATYGTVYLGDKKKGREHYGTFNNTYVPDWITIKDEPEIGEAKNYSPYVRSNATPPKAVTFHGAEYAMGNTEEVLKHRNLGTYERGVRAAGDFNHQTGDGWVASNMDKAHYRDARCNKKAKVHLLVHETSGGMSQYGARRLRRLGRDAFESGQDATDYNLSYTARSFVPYYAQRMSNAIVINGAQGILNGINKMRRDRLRRNS